jgi:hypothetical protein
VKKEKKPKVKHVVVHHEFPPLAATLAGVLINLIVAVTGVVDRRLPR